MMNYKSGIIVTASILMLSACQKPNLRVGNEPLPMEQSIKLLANNMVDEVGHGWLWSKDLVVKPFLDEDSGQVTEASLKIEKVFISTLNDRYGIRATRINSKNVKASDYILSGIIEYSTHESGNKYFKVKATAVNKDSKVTESTQSVWLEEKLIAPQPTPFYADNPLYIRGESLAAQKAILDNKVDTALDNDKSDYLLATGLVTEAQEAYSNRKYQRAADLFKKLSQTSTQYRTETYAGLYISNLQLGYRKVANKGFRSMINAAAKEGSIPIKFKFQSASTDFINNKLMRQQYPVWIDIIGDYFGDNPNQCVAVVGHSSVAGNKQYNLNLSQQRAQVINDQLADAAGGISSVVEGKGPVECIRCTRPDDASNAIDRRVELKIVDCANIPVERKDDELDTPSDVPDLPSQGEQLVMLF